jgi:hypothetical protein
MVWRPPGYSQRVRRDGEDLEGEVLSGSQRLFQAPAQNGKG